MLGQIEDRFNSYNDDDNVFGMKDSVLDRASTCICSVISFEDWIHKFDDADMKSDLIAFYKRCLQFNGIV